LHPHLNCVIPAGGFDPGYSRYLALLQQAPRQRRLDCPSTLVRALLKDD
jgi:hypothetical protein